MLEVIVFAVVLVAAQIIGGFAVMSLMMNEKFIKHYTMKMFKVMTDLNEELDEMIKKEL